MIATLRGTARSRQRDNGQSAGGSKIVYNKPVLDQFAKSNFSNMKNVSTDMDKEVPVNQLEVSEDEFYRCFLYAANIV